MTTPKDRLRRLTCITIAVSFVLTAAACQGGDQEGATGEGLPEVVKVVSINPTTGVVAFAGEAANAGYELAIKEINEQGFLEGTTLELATIDSAGEAQTAAQEMSKVASGNEFAAVFGSVVGSDALVMSPIAQSKKVPTIYTQAGADGVLVGDYTYRVSTPVKNYYSVVEKFLADGGYKSVGVIFSAFSPTLVDVTEEALPAIADELGIKITKTVGVQATTQDFVAPISQILSDDPDLVALLLSGQVNATAIQQLRQAGYDGKILTQTGVNPALLEPAGEDAAGTIIPTDFNHLMPGESTQSFVEAYKAAHGGEPPLNFSAQAYDAAWFLARAIKKAQSADREDIKSALAEVATTPFTGALGENLTFVDNDIQVPGVVIEWDGSQEKFLYSGDKAE